MSRRLPYRSRALAALLLLCLLVFPACSETGEGNNASEEARSASDAEINRAAQGEGERTALETGDSASMETTSTMEEDATFIAVQQAEETAFDHQATADNSRGDYTYLDDPSINGDPEAAVFATPTSNAEDAEDDVYDHNVGVWFEPEQQQWAIFNQDLAEVPAETAFRVVVPAGDETFIHHSTPENTSANGTYVDHPLTNGNPGATLSVTQNWNPGGGNGVYNDHPVDTRYDAGRGKWRIFNEDGSAMPGGAAFNVTTSDAAREAGSRSIAPDPNELPEYRSFYAEGDPETPTDLISSNPSVGAIPPVRPFNFGRDPGGPEDKTLYLTIPKLGIEGMPVFDTLSEEKLRDGTVHIPATGYPWQEGANVFIAGHRLGYPNTLSYYVFFDLNELAEGDKIFLRDSAGRDYQYRVTQQKIVGPENVEVMNAAEGRSLISLQTCTLPDYKERLIIQGELVEQGA